MVPRIALRCRAIAGRRVFQIGVYFVSMLALFALAAHAAGRMASIAASMAPSIKSIGDAGDRTMAKPAMTAKSALPTHAAAMSVLRSASQGSVTLAQSWYEDIGRHSYWRDRPRRRDYRDRYERRERGRRWRDEDERYDNENRWGDDAYYSRDGDGGGTYRTVCVRLCDGFYWPISFSTTPDHFGSDSRKCEASCGSPAELYVYPNPGGVPENMESLDGEPYSKLKAAFLYRTKYDAACKCRPNPWEPEAKQQHRIYALEARKRKGDKAAAEELRELRAGQRASLEEAAPSEPSSRDPRRADAAESPSVDPVPRPSQSSRDDRRMSLGARSSPALRPAAVRPMGTWSDWSKSSP